MMNNIEDREADCLARGERCGGRVSLNELMGTARRYASYPAIDDRPADEILGYDELGLPG